MVFIKMVMLYLINAGNIMFGDSNALIMLTSSHAVVSRGAVTKQSKLLQ